MERIAMLACVSVLNMKEYMTKSVSIFCVGTVAAILVSTTGCGQLPGSPQSQGAAIGGIGGAVAGAALAGENNRLLGALIGGAIGAGGGYLIGASSDRITRRDSVAAEDAMRRAQTSPASPEQARNAHTADLNGDAFVTMDEVIAMRKAGVDDQTMVERLRATGQVFELNPEQHQYLWNQGISDYVLSQMIEVNRDIRDTLLQGQTAVIGRPPRSQ